MIRFLDAPVPHQSKMKFSYFERGTEVLCATTQSEPRLKQDRLGLVIHVTSYISCKYLWCIQECKTLWQHYCMTTYWKERERERCCVFEYLCNNQWCDVYDDGSGRMSKTSSSAQLSCNHQFHTVLNLNVESKAEGTAVKHLQISILIWHQRNSFGKKGKLMR